MTSQDMVVRELSMVKSQKIPSLSRSKLVYVIHYGARKKCMLGWLLMRVEAENIF